FSTGSTASILRENPLRRSMRREGRREDEITFFAGQVLDILSYEGDWWVARDPRSGKKGQVARNYLLPPASLFQVAFTTRCISEEPAERSEAPSHLKNYLLRAAIGTRFQIMDASGEYWIAREIGGTIGLIHSTCLILPSFFPILFLAQARCDPHYHALLVEEGHKQSGISFLKNDILAILRIQSEDTWQVRLQDGRVGLAPIHCFQVKELNMEGEEEFQLPLLHAMPRTYDIRALCSCSIPPFPNGLSYRRNDIVQVIRERGDGRLIVKSASGLVGVVHPDNFSPLPLLKVIAEYSPRDGEELTLKRGDLLTLHKVLSPHCFKARSSSGEEGLIPANHVG
ncbi:hypothetical protein BJ684DRAFT_17111, partial [Piptocephalis cylindrospora]